MRVLGLVLDGRLVAVVKFLTAIWQKKPPASFSLAVSPVRAGPPGTQYAEPNDAGPIVSCGHLTTQNTRFAANRAAFRH
jgi:hypothetical protein